MGPARHVTDAIAPGRPARSGSLRQFPSTGPGDPGLSTPAGDVKMFTTAEVGVAIGAFCVPP